MATNGAKWSRLTLEALVIVASILMAFAIDAWWARSQDRQEEVRLLTALKAEFEENRGRLAEAQDFHAEVQVSIVLLMELSATRDVSISADSVHHLLGDLSWWYESTSFATGALNSVLLGGRLSLIRDERLRQELAGWQTAIDYVSAREIQDYETFREVWMPFLRESAQLPRVANQINRRPGTTTEREPASGPTLPLTRDPRELLGRPDFHNVLLTKRWVQSDILGAYMKFDGELASVIELIESVIGGR